VAGHRIKPYEPLTLDEASISPRRLGLRESTFNHSEDTLEIAPTAQPSGRLPMPQATEWGWNDRDQQIAANGLSTPLDAIAILLHRLVRGPPPRSLHRHPTPAWSIEE